MEHDLTNDKESLGIRRLSLVTGRVIGRAGSIKDRECLPDTGQMLVIAALDKKTFAPFGRLSASAKSGRIWREVKHSVGREDRSGHKGVFDAAIQAPAGDVHSN